MIKKEKYEELVKQVLELVGGKTNISSLTHCMTRLRFNIKDQSIIDLEAIKAVPGVIGCQFSSDQFQIIIGPDVKKVFDKMVLAMGDTLKQPIVEKEKLTIKSAISKIITNFTSCIIPALPIIMCAGMLKMIMAVFGPTLLGWMHEGSGIYEILTFAGDTGFYFIPVYLGYTSAKYFKTSVFVGMFLGAVLIHPTLINIATKGTNFNLIGLPVTVVNYAYSVLPIVLIVWVMSYVRIFFEKVIPEILQNILVDVLTIFVMLPLALCILGPLGNILSVYVNMAFLTIHDILGPIGIGIIASLFLLLIITGMHHAVMFAALVVLSEVGYDSVVFVALAAGVGSILGANLAFILKAKKTENRGIAISATFMQVVAGIVEPTLFGIYLPYRRVFLAQSVGAFCGGTILGVLGVKLFAYTGSSVLIMTGFLGGGMNNFIYASIGCLGATIVAFIATFVISFEEK